jgi:hypothetical protein
LLYTKLKIVKNPRASFDQGGQSTIKMGNGMEENTKSKPLPRMKFREKPSNSPQSGAQPRA